ncbi:uncharacterized protein LOC123293114 [Chrysoperla carnea]|uniref:uncharacterized protein LOC123293114 n=1 Tax=Chrysoperla carnea TaxID=189513 RepID=UPI001D08C9E7|nr:uncharacterized protein LOC123293114 [Chrysoperla carnea]
MPNRPKVIKYVLNAIVELGDKNGSPLTSIIDLVRTNIAIDDVKPRPHNIALHTRRALQMAIEEGLVVEPIRGRYKLVVDEEDTFIPRIRPTICKNQCQKTTPSSKPNDNLDNHDNPNLDNTKVDGIVYCSSCGGKRRNKCTRAKPDKCGGKRCKRSKCSKCCKSKRRCGENRGGCSECRPPPIPRTPCTPPTPRQPCPPSPPCPPKTPCDYFENEGFDCQAENPLQDDRNDQKSQTPRPINNRNCRRSIDALPPENENELCRGEKILQLDSDGKELTIEKLYFGPGSLDQCPLINPHEPAEQMDSADPTDGSNNKKTQDLMNEYII